MNIKVDDDRLHIDGRSVKVPYPIAQVLSYEGLVVVRVEPPPGAVFNRNVMAFTSSAALVWQIEASPHGTENDKPYVGIAVDDQGALIAMNWNGIDYEVKSDSGEVVPKVFKK